MIHHIIYNREEFAGVTWHIVKAKIDSGAILLQEKIRIDEDDTAMKLMLKCFNAGCRLFRENLEGFLSGGLVPHEGDSSGENRLYLAKDIPNDGYANLNWDFGQLWAFLRSMDYTGANIMPLPKITIGGKDFEVVGYKTDTNTQNSYKGISELRIYTYGGGIFCSCVKCKNFMHIERMYRHKKSSGQHFIRRNILSR